MATDVVNLTIDTCLQRLRLLAANCSEETKRHLESHFDDVVSRPRDWLRTEQRGTHVTFYPGAALLVFQEYVQLMCKETNGLVT